MGLGVKPHAAGHKAHHGPVGTPQKSTQVAKVSENWNEAALPTPASDFDSQPPAASMNELGGPSMSAPSPAGVVPVMPLRLEGAHPEMTPFEFESMKAWAERLGVPVPEGEVTVVALRRIPNAISGPRFEDTLFVFTSDHRLKQFVGNTKPAQSASETHQFKLRAGVGMVRPGVYMAYGDGGRSFDGRPAYRVSDGEGKGDSMPVWRDKNDDGLFSAEERAASEANHARGGAIRIHTAFGWPYSVGCSNVTDPQLDEFVAAVGGPEASFRYAIVEDDGSLDGGVVDTTHASSGL